jgi:hypothetical protein
MAGVPPHSASALARSDRRRAALAHYHRVGGLAEQPGLYDAELRAPTSTCAPPNGIGPGEEVVDIGLSVGDAEATARILERAGFDEIRFEDIHEPVLYGHDLDAALALVRGFQDTSAALASLSDGEAAGTVERLRETLAGALQRRARRGPRFAFLVDHGAAMPLRH